VTKTDKAELFAGYWNLLVDDEDATPTREYRFHPDRRWRFDFAWPECRVAVEVDGNAWNTKGGGRHAQDGDREKINAAMSLDWRVFHFSPQMIKADPVSCVMQVLSAVESRSDE
jgi:very-short-patch-repair endonuclease